MELLEKSIVIAYSSHAGQLDKQGKPYILHPLAVLVNVMQHERYGRLDPNEREEAVCVAILHDVVEDTAVSLEDIYARLQNKAIVEAVDAITHRRDEPLEEYWARVKRNAIARLVKLCDIQHNTDPARSLPDARDNDRRADKYRRARDFLRYC